MKNFLIPFLALLVCSVARAQFTVTRTSAFVVQQPNLAFTTPNIGVAGGTSLLASSFLSSPYWASTGTPAGAGAIRLGNGELIAWEASPAGTDVTMTVNSAETFIFSNAATFGGNIVSGTASGTGAQVEVNRSSTYTSEGTAGIYIISGAADSSLLLGASAAADISYIQSMQSGTSTSNRPLWIMPNGGSTLIGLVASPVTISPTGAITATAGISTGGVAAFAGASASASTAVITPAGTTAVSSLRVPHGVAPTSPVNGDVWSTTTGLNVRINGATVALGAGSGNVTNSGTLTSTAIATGAGTTVVQTPSATSTLDSSGNMALAGNITVSGSAGIALIGAGGVAGTVTLTEGTNPALVANSFQIIAPTDVAVGGLKYIVPAAGATGIMRAANSSGNMTISHSELSGDITTSGSNAATLATVNSNVGTFGSATVSSVVTLNAKGLVTAGSNATITPSAASITAGTLTANITLGENFGFIYDAALGTADRYSGIVRAGTAGATLAFGDLIYLAAADSRWELTDADSATTSGNVLIGICVLAAAADGDPTTILLQGFVRADTAFPALTVGAPAYISPTAGDVQVAAPSTTGQIVRRVGFAWTADELYFNPSMDSGTAP